MKKLLFILSLVLTVLVSFSQEKTIQYMSGPGTRALIRDQIQIDSVFFLPLRTDTNFVPARTGAFILRTADTLLYYYNGVRWEGIGSGDEGTTYTFQDGVYESGGVVKSDTALMATRARVQKAIDSLAALNPLSPEAGGGEGAVQYDSANAFSGNANQFYWDRTNNRLGINTSGPIAQLSIDKHNIGPVKDTTGGILLQNSTAAVSGYQQRSPPIRFVGQGWKTGAPAGSQRVEVVNYVLPVQGTTRPTINLNWDYKYPSDTGFSRLMSITSSGIQHIGSGSGGGLSFSGTAPAANTIYGTNKLWFGLSSTALSPSYFFSVSNGYTATSDEVGVMNITAGGPETGFYPSSGTATFYTVKLNPVINQTGSATGVSRGLYVDPLLTSAADFRSIETSGGKVKFQGQVIHQSSLVQTTNNVATTIATIPLSTAGQEIEIDISIQAEFSTNRAFYKRLLRAKNVSGTVTLQGSFQTIGTDYEDAGISTADVSATVSGKNILIQATGIAATNINWKSQYYLRYFE